ncbi:hypothetical protein E2C01_050024 [Portunus trituberculatus]|uniref:Uncharacterized protein n=1 Tax=Portunus trituberculatus TaxID=210409 RepID=A0A5B7GHT2_PORTR|nr:hypothetical protein [Portunus trituberculatus]
MFVQSPVAPVTEPVCYSRPVTPSHTVIDPALSQPASQPVIFSKPASLSHLARHALKQPASQSAARPSSQPVTSV